MSRKRARKWLAEQHARDPHCHFCGMVTWYGEPNGKPEKRRATVDHFIPLSWGGPCRAENYRVSCEECNKAKGADFPTDIRAVFEIAQATGLSSFRFVTGR